jgi:hypothetical protein
MYPLASPLPDPETEPGARLPGEPAAAWAAFCAYRDMGLTRSIRAAYRQRHGNEEAPATGQPSGHWNAWARDWRWRQRAEAYDAHLDRQARLAQVEAVREMNSQHVRTFKAVRAKALQALAKITAEDLTPQDIVRWLVEATKGERLALGQVTEAVRSEQSGETKTELVVVEKIVRTREEARENTPALPPATGGADALPESERGLLDGGPAGAMDPRDALTSEDLQLPDSPP